MIDKKYNVLVLDTQPIDPPIGGGRLRLLGLYHNIGKNFSTRYIGTYDWPGEKFRDHYLSDTLREIDIPLSSEHFIECRKWQERVGGKTIIDSTFPNLAHLSADYVQFVRNEVLMADIIIFSHPWVYPLVKGSLNLDVQTIIYDSHNVEGYLKCTLLDDKSIGTDIVRGVVRIEAELCHFADFILACSYEDRVLINRFYNVPLNKIKIVPNGVFTEKIKVVRNVEEKRKIKEQLRLGEHITSIFIGSNYAPNLEACDYIINELAPNLPEMTFVIAGGVGDGINNYLLADVRNVQKTGFLTENEKIMYLAASDMAINPMLSGSGTNIKMFDFMAAGLPIITTKIGSRGITETDFAGIVLSDRYGFTLAVRNLMDDPQKSRHLGELNRDLVEKNYSWEKISPKLGAFLHNSTIKKNGQLNKSLIGSLNNYRFAIMTSWNIRCGIAEHSRYLANSLELSGVDLRIIANSNTDQSNSYLIDDMTRDVYPLWKYDYLTWRDTEIDKKGILRLLKQEGISKLNIQYHLGFFNQQELLDLVKLCTRAGIQISVTLHNPKELYFDTFMEMNKLNATIIVHNSEYKMRLEVQGINNVYYIPLGILEFPDEDMDRCRRELGISGYPVIGSFGFLRPHKGILEAIESVGILRDQYPDIKLLAVNAMYPSDDSIQYLQICNDRINELNLSDNIIFITDFLNIKQAVKYLHASDVIVLPYHESKEGSSAAANTVIASRRPLIISKSDIFNEIKDIGYEVENITPEALAIEIRNVVSRQELIHQMKTKVVNYADENSYTKIAAKYIELIGLQEKIDFESMVQEVYEAVLEPGDIAVDVGAHIGRHTIPIANQIYPDGKVFAFEPLPACQKLLTKSIQDVYSKLKGNISLYPYALSDYEGESEFSVVTNDLGYSGLKERKYDSKSGVEKIQVKVKKLDNVLPDIMALKYIKIDAEGGEFNILKGGINTIKKFRPVVTFEFGESSYAAYSVIAEEVYQFWNELNYQIFDILGNLLNSETKFSESSINQNVWDYIAIPLENISLTNKVINAIKGLDI